MLLAPAFEVLKVLLDAASASSPKSDCDDKEKKHADAATGSGSSDPDGKHADAAAGLWMERALVAGMVVGAVVEVGKGVAVGQGAGMVGWAVAEGMVEGWVVL